MTTAHYCWKTRTAIAAKVLGPLAVKAQSNKPLAWLFEAWSSWHGALRVYSFNVLDLPVTPLLSYPDVFITHTKP